MARVIMGDEDSFGALAFGLPSQGTVDYLRNQLGNLSSIADSAKGFMNNVVDSFRRWDTGEVMNKVRNVLNLVDNTFNQDLITQYLEEEAFRNATFKMQNVIMANPFIRQQWQQGRISGYAETYFDAEPGTIGITNTDYRMYTEGIIQTLEPTEELPDGATWWMNHYEELPDGTRALHVAEQGDAMRTWDAAQYILRMEKTDFTDV